MAQALSMNHYPNYTMTLTGQGVVIATPDLAVIYLGVQTTGSNLSQMQSENAQISQRLIEALNEIGVTEIKTIQYAIDKMYEYEDGKQIDAGYSVRNILEIKTSNINEVGNIIDTAVNTGANIVLSVSFTLSDPTFYYQQALNLAVDHAIQKAKTISTNLNVRLNSIPIRIIEGASSAIPMQQLQYSVATTPILPGDLNIEAFVNADFLYMK